jgi:hypothetical protein
MGNIVKMKIGWEAINWVYPETIMSSEGDFVFESVVETQVPLKVWHRLATKGFLKELNNIVPTNTHTLPNLHLLQPRAQ